MFGIPILLFLDFPLTEILFYLLPVSAVLSFKQVFDFRSVNLGKNQRYYFSFLILPTVALGMLLSKYFFSIVLIHYLVFFLLVFTFVLRVSKSTLSSLSERLFSNKNISLVIMGLIHGLTSMGGALLNPIMVNLFQTKEKVLAAVSFCYFVMVSFQLIVLSSIYSAEFLESKYLIGIPMALIMKEIAGSFLWKKTRDQIYQQLINYFILLNATILGFKLF